jgi:NAD+ kinase
MPKSAKNSRPRALMLAHATKPQIQQQAAEVVPVLEKYVDIVATVEDISCELPPEMQADNEIDFVVVLGGDGSMLRAAHAMGYCQKPVLGVNLGHLGFLADLQPERLDTLLPQVVAGEYRVVNHLMFECDVQRAGGDVLNMLGLNEVAVLAGPPFAIIDVQLYVDAQLVTTYSCDGLIVSTPVGSTAHSLSAGGPILRKNLQAFVISPISPHTLTNRPVVDSADRVYELAVAEPHEGTTLVVDGKVVCQLTAADRVRITRSEAEFQLIEVQGHGYYRTLREKLGWGGRLKYND